VNSDLVRHLVVRDPGNYNRIGSWATSMLAACGLHLPPHQPREVTCRLDLTTCEGCKMWAQGHMDKMRQDSLGYWVVL